MIDKNWRVLSRNNGTGVSRNRLVKTGGTIWALAGVAMVVSLDGQSQESVSDPAAASGMTTGLPGVSTQREAEMMVIRARAQAARPEAERAAMERSAEEALEKKSEDRILSEARETKRLKQEAARQLEHQKAANAYESVSSNEMNSWSDDSGRVRVERGVPPEVLRNLPEEDESESEEELEGFHPFKRTKKAAQSAARATGGAAGAVVGAAKKSVSWIPGIGDKDAETGITASPRSNDEYSEAYESSDEGESQGMLSRIPLVGGLMNKDDDSGAVETQAAAEPEEQKEGFFRGMTSRIPLVGGKNKEAEALTYEESAPEPSPVIVGQSTSSEQPVAAPPPPPPALSEIPSVDSLIGPESGGVSPDAGAEMAAAENDEGGFFKKIPLIGSRKSAEPTAVQEADQMPMAAEEKSGIGGGLKNMFGKVIPGGNSKNEAEIAGGNGLIDPGLFPQDGDPELMMADQSAGKKKFFSKRPKLPELPDLSIPTPGGGSDAESPKPETPIAKNPRSPVHSGGNSYYIVKNNGAQFMRFAGGPLGSEAQSLNAGTRVKMTKVGDDWSSVQLSNGSTGVIRNADLKPAGAGEASGSFASQMPSTGGLATNSSGGARITAPVSATGAGISDTPGPPVSIPTSSLTGGGLSTGASGAGVE